MKKIEKCLDIAHRFAERLVDPGGNAEELDSLFEEEPELRGLYESIARDVREKRRTRINEEEWLFFQKKFLNRKRRRGLVFFRYAAAVVVIAVVTVVLSLYMRQPEVPERVMRIESHGVPTLSVNDKVYMLNLQGLSELEQETRAIRHLEDKGITYLSDLTDSLEQVWHTIQVPRQVEFPVTLADGTRVRLNAGTTLRYPVPFSDTIREIWLEGEAYFDVTPDKCKPFIVHFDENRVRVLGTAFNVSCYMDCPSYTTLVNGSVSLQTPVDTIVLRPGEEGCVLASKRITVQQADIEETMAWLNRKFYFKEKPLSEILYSIGEWYGVDILFENEVSRDMIFSVETQRYGSIDSVLQIIESTGKVRFIRDDNNLKVKCNQ